MKRACVLGMGSSGRAAASYLSRKGYSVTCVDDNPKSGFKIESLRMEDFELFCPAPGIPRTHPLYESAKLAGIEIAGEMELALRELKDHPCIAVTGTNGKTTVVCWIEKLLNAAGIPARALGNIGEVMLDYLPNEKAGEVLVVEVSSFQIETLAARAFDVGLLLNITPDHLYRYASYDEYAKTKCLLQNCVRGKFYVYREAAAQFGQHLINPYETYSIDPIVKTGRFNSPHDLENATAVWKVAQHFGISAEFFQKALDSFEKPPHRIECVAVVDGVTYINDSKATNVDAMVKALEGMQAPVILLAGGLDKGGSFRPVLDFKAKIRQIFAFGQCREKIESELASDLPVEVCEKMQDATRRAMEIAREGEVVLLSPGCASLDSFKSYAHRGEEFKRIIKEKP